MDYGYLNFNPPIALHDLEEESVAKAIKSFPTGYNPFPQHYEETERNGNDHFVQTSDPGSINNEVHPCFGALSHTHRRNGLYYFRHLQGLEFGLRRPEDGGLYESAKFNQRLNPRVDRVGNYNLERTDQKRTNADMIAGSLVHFPNIGGLVTSVSHVRILTTGKATNIMHRVCIRPAVFLLRRPRLFREAHFSSAFGTFMTSVIFSWKSSLARRRLSRTSPALVRRFAQMSITAS